MDSLVNRYIPLKKLTKKEIRNQFKPWITNGIRKSMKRRDKIYKKYIKVKNDESKREYEKQYKTLRNQTVTLGRDSKKAHFQNYFLSNVKNTWKGINKIININNKCKTSPSSLIVNNKLISIYLFIYLYFNHSC